MEDISAIIDRLQSRRAHESFPESQCQALLKKVRRKSEEGENEILLLRENRKQLLAIIDLIPVAFFVKDQRAVSF